MTSVRASFDGEISVWARNRGALLLAGNVDKGPTRRRHITYQPGAEQRTAIHEPLPAALSTATQVNLRATRPMPR